MRPLVDVVPLQCSWSKFRWRRTLHVVTVFGRFTLRGEAESELGGQFINRLWPYVLVDPAQSLCMLVIRLVTVAW